ncbi:O-antigen ligase family protein [Arenibaculum sp.]|jgi:O-antigen ligase|uniref:O-antigen ligase family protein n=1 Tax=Arenibaculum sp. TaxID=2865862 RepID=UPI002E123379|nr:O-antigen ligase family protein [Arenibaculum sp.]
MTAEPLPRGGQPLPGVVAVCTVLYAAASFSWGTSQIDPYALFDVGPFNAGDFLYFAGLLLLLAAEEGRRLLWRVIDEAKPLVFLGFAFAALWIASIIAGLPLSGEGSRAALPMVRFLFYVPVVFVTAALVVRYGVPLTGAPYFLGIVFGALLNLWQSVSDGGRITIEGLPVLFNPNVTGNMLAVAVLVAALLARRGAMLSSLLGAALASALCLLTFSKGGWLTTAFALLAFAGSIWSAFRSGRVDAMARVTALSLLVCVCLVGASQVPTAVRIVSAKVVATNFDSVSLDSSIAIRWYHLWSSLDMVAENPLFGVGPGRWPEENRANAYWLGDMFYENDNPHNGFAYIVSTMGVPAFLTYLCLLCWMVWRVAASHPPGRGTVLVALGFAGAFAVSGLVMLQIMTHTFAWFLSGLAVGEGTRGTAAGGRAGMARTVSGSRA